MRRRPTAQERDGGATADPSVSVHAGGDYLKGVSRLGQDRVLAWGGHNARLYATDGTLIAEYNVPDRELEGAIELPEGKFALGQFQTDVEILSMADGLPVGVLPVADVDTLQVDEDTIVVNRSDRLVWVNWRSGETVHELTFEKWRCDLFDLGSHLLCAPKDGGKPVAVDLVGRTTITFKSGGHRDETKGALRLDGDHFVTWSDDKTIKIWSLSFPKPLATLRTKSKRNLEAGALLPDGKLVVTFNYDKAQVWDLATRKKVASVKELSDEFHQVDGGGFLSWSYGEAYHIDAAWKATALDWPETPETVVPIEKGRFACLAYNTFWIVDGKGEIEAVHTFEGGGGKGGCTWAMIASSPGMARKPASGT